MTSIDNFTLIEQRPVALPMIAWTTCLFGLAPVGVIIAYMERGRSPHLQDQYTYLIRTFWIGILYFFIAATLSVILIGLPLIIATSIWYLVRCIKAMLCLSRSEVLRSPTTWLV